MSRNELAHGASRYRNNGCRCDECRRGHAEQMLNFQKERRASRQMVNGRLIAPLPAEHHGRAHTYNSYGCRCDRCTEAIRLYAAARRARKRQGVR